jgi:hypothetical protein
LEDVKGKVIRRRARSGFLAGMARAIDLTASSGYSTQRRAIGRSGVGEDLKKLRGDAARVTSDFRQATDRERQRIA